MSDILAERSGHILSLQLNRPAKKNAMTSSRYLAMAELLADAAHDDDNRVVLFGSSYLFPLRFGYDRAAELILLGRPFAAAQAADFGLVTQVVPDQALLATATDTARILTAKAAAAVRACKRLMKSATREHSTKP